MRPLLEGWVPVRPLSGRAGLGASALARGRLAPGDVQPLSLARGRTAVEDARSYQPRNWRSEPVASPDWLGYPVCRGRGIYRGAPLPPATGPGDGRRRPGPRVTLSFPPPRLS